MTVPDAGAYDKSVHLSFDDIAIDETSSPSFVRVRIKQSKTDPFCRGVNLFLGRTHTDLCPVAAHLSDLVVRGAGPGPLFKFADGRPLTRSRFVAQVRDALGAAGINEGSYCGPGEVGEYGVSTIRPDSSGTAHWILPCIGRIALGRVIGCVVVRSYDCFVGVNVGGGA